MIKHITLFCLCVCLLTVSAAPSAAAGKNRGPVEVTYVGNEGFLIVSGGKKVLVDALYREGVPGYVVLPVRLRQVIERAGAPFDKIDLVLATHFHADHFDPAAVGAYLLSSNSALFVSTHQSMDRLRGQLSSNPQIVKWARAEFPIEGRRIKLAHHGVSLEVLNVHHGRGRTIENLGFIIELNGWRFLHIGDSQGGAEDFRRNNLHEEKFDVAFIPYWYLAYDGMTAAITEVIRADRIVAMHVPPRGLRNSHLSGLGGWDGMKKKIKPVFPNVVFFENEMEKKTFAP